MMMDWDGHINGQFCRKTFVVLYLLKYLFKGVTKVVVVLGYENDIGSEQQEQVDHQDEIKNHEWGHMSRYARYVDAVVDGKVCDILIYFNRP